MAEDVATWAGGLALKSGWPFTIGAIWGLLAPVIHVAMMRGSLPPPDKDPLGLLRVFIDLPFIAAAGIETAIGRPSPSLPEIAFVALLVGGSSVWAIVKVVALVRRRFQRW